MKTLSTERINQTSPYKVISAGEGVVRFITDKALVYEAGFIEDYSLVQENGYQFYLKEISGKSAAADAKIMQTIWAIFEEFFAQNESVVLYICDISDGHQAARARIFAKWFHTFEHEDRYTFIDGNITFEEICYFAAAIIAKSNPHHDEYVEAFMLFKEGIEQKFR